MSSSSKYTVDEISSQSSRDNESSWLFSNSSKRRKESKTNLSSYSTDEGSYLITNSEGLQKSLLEPKPRAILPTSGNLFTILIATSALVFLIVMALHPCPIIAAFSPIYKSQDSDSATGIESYPDQEARFKDRTFTIALLGDSLVNKPFQMFQLSEKIQAHLPGYKLNIINCGSNGAEIGQYKLNISSSFFLIECCLPCSMTNFYDYYWLFSLKQR